MARYFDVHPENPQVRSLQQVAEIIDSGGLIAYPTDSGFALGTKLGNKEGLDRMRKLRQLGPKKNFAVMCSEFAQVGAYVQMNTAVFRLIKSLTPGPYTFILKATRDVPRVTLQPKKKTIGIRIPDHVTALALLDFLGEPLATSSLILPGEERPMAEGWQVADELANELDAVLDSGDVGVAATTVVDLSGDEPVVTRVGAGDPSPFIQ